MYKRVKIGSHTTTWMQPAAFADKVKLHAWGNRKIRDVSYMTSLRELDAGWESGISDAGIKGLKLLKLNAVCNTKITDTSSILLSTSNNERIYL